MPRRCCAFTEADVKRLIHAVTAAGLKVYGVKRHSNGDVSLLTDKDAVTVSGQDMKSITPEEVLKLL